MAKLRRTLLRRIQQRLSPKAQRLLERALAAAGFPTNASGNNMSMR